MLASGLFGSPAAIVSSDVALDASDPIVGSFTVDGLTYAVNNGGATLISVGATFVVAPYEGSADSGDGSAIAVPASVTYGGTTYSVTAIGPYTFYLSGVASVALPASVSSVDDRAFRSSDVERVEVDQANPNLASYEGCLYDSQLTSLLLIPEGRVGSVPIPSEAEVVEASKFSHCSLVDAISVDGDGADFASWEGLLYSADGTTLLRVPAGATEITIRDGCTAIAVGAMEGCAKLERINAPASVTSISPDLFTSIPTVSLPATAVARVDSVAGPLAGPGYEGDARSASADSPAEGEAATQPSSQDEASSGVTSSLLDQAEETTDFIPQLTAMVALSTTDDDLPEVDPSSIGITLPEGGDVAPWQVLGFSVAAAPPSELTDATLGEGAFYALSQNYWCVRPNDVNRGHIIVTSYKYSSGSVPLNTPLPIAHVSSSGDSSSYVYCTGAADGSYSWYSQGRATYQYGYVLAKQGYRFMGWSAFQTGTPSPTFSRSWYSGDVNQWAIFDPIDYTIALDANGPDASVSPTSIAAAYDAEVTLPVPVRPGYRFLGWNTAADGSGTVYQPGTVRNLTDQDGTTVTLYAQWERVDYDIGFDTSSEPGDADYPGDAKPDESANIDSGQVPIEDPKRPGYVFEGWVIPNGDGIEAVDQELVYQGDDGKWYVDASKLPDYAGDDGRVELTARWTSVISVDVPSSVTFYADLVTQGQESREGAASSAFGQSKVANQSQVDLRVVGLESSAVKTTDTTLGADSVLKKADAATPSSSTQKLLSLYPSTKQWTADELQDPDAVGGDKATTAVDFDLDDILLEKSFAADDFTIAAGGTLNMGYRLNLTETGQQLDYDKLATLQEGQSASIANVSYCFSTSHCLATGTTDDDIYIEYGGKVYGTADILHAADCISEFGEASPCYALYDAIMCAQGEMASGYLPANAGAKVYARFNGSEAHAGQPNCDKAGYVRLLLIGVYHDVLELKAGYPDAGGFAGDGSKDPTDGAPYVVKRAGLTFQFADSLFQAQMNADDFNQGGWAASQMRNQTLSKNGGIYKNLAISGNIKPVYKFNNNDGGDITTEEDPAPWQEVTTVTRDELFLLSLPETLGAQVGEGSNQTPGRWREWVNHGGYQYEYFSKVLGVFNDADDASASNESHKALSRRWGRGAALSKWFLTFPSYNNKFGIINEVGLYAENASYNGGVVPAFCL